MSTVHDQLAGELRGNVTSGLTRPLAWRHHQLHQLSRFLREQADALTSAMGADMGKPDIEGWLTDVAAVRRDVVYADRHLERWTAPTRRAVPWTLQPGRARTVPEPLGAVLVIGPWNYPVRCLLLPAAFALAAGNSVAVKPSELAPATSRVIAETLPRYLGPDALRVVEGGPETVRHLLSQRWDHVFFTGGARVGRIVMTAAAQHLTPVTLELGGKNPAVVDPTADIPTAARRIVWAKFLNAGQTCVAPDYVVVHRDREAELLDALAAQVRHAFGEDPRRSPDYARVVDDRHVQRLTDLLWRTEAKSVVGGASDPSQRYVPPTVLAGVSWDDAVMEEEIFGPLLPVLAYDDLDELLVRMATREKPLALYLYSRDRGTMARFVNQTSSGSVSVNHSAVQLAVPELPFGGVGASGTGAYHGKAGFDTFSHHKAVLVKPPRGEIPLMYPPYGRFKRWLLGRVL